MMIRHPFASGPLAHAPASRSHRSRTPRRFSAVLLTAIPALAALALPLHAQQTAQSPRADSAGYRGRAGLVYGQRHAFIVRAPAGWTLDSRSGRRQGLQIVLYPNGESWARSTAVMYCHVIPKTASVSSARELIALEETRFRNQSAEAAVTEAPTIRIGDSATALVRGFSGGRNHALEQTAYIEERGVIVSLVLSSRSAETFAGALPAFADLVRSYRFLADDEENILRAVEAVEDEMNQ